jgi:hypothetical protein
VDGDGKAILERSVPCEIEDVTECLLAFRTTELRTGFEAEAMSQFLFFGLQAEGFEVVRQHKPLDIVTVTR